MLKVPPMLTSPPQSAPLPTYLQLTRLVPPGFARWLGGSVHSWLGDGYWSNMAQLYLANDALILGLGVYDLVTRRRLHPAYVIGVVWVLTLQMSAVGLYLSPWWKPISQRLVGH